MSKFTFTEQVPLQGDYIKLITVHREAGRWWIKFFTDNDLEYLIDSRKYKYIARAAAEGMATILGQSNKANGWPLELQVYNILGKLKGKGSKQSYGHDDPKVEG
jgi:hypothetical protein